MDEQTPRRIISQATHHRRRRRVAVALAAAAALLAVLLLALGGGGGGRDGESARGDARSERARQADLEAARAAATLERQASALRAEDASVVRALRRLPLVRVAGEQTRSVALTFDDGPGPYTRRILDTLRRHGAQATFFVLGMEAGRRRLELHRAIADGHAIGNHSWAHADLTEGTAERARLQILDANAALVAAGVPRPRLLRPPYGAHDQRVLRTARRLGMLTVMWSVDPGDYEATSARGLAAAVLADARPGSIILLHDGGGNRTVTVRALPLILSGLRRRGLRMVTVPRLLSDNPPPADQSRAGSTPAA